jgi:hypothetical protein
MGSGLRPSSAGSVGSGSLGFSTGPGLGTDGIGIILPEAPISPLHTNVINDGLSAGEKRRARRAADRLARKNGKSIPIHVPVAPSSGIRHSITSGSQTPIGSVTDSTQVLRLKANT